MRWHGRRARPDGRRGERSPAYRRTIRPSPDRQRARAIDRHPPVSSPAQISSRFWKRQIMTETAVLICGHGSRDPEAIAEFELVAAALRPRLPDVDFATGYLEFARPTIRDGLAELAAAGARRILAIPGMLVAASHVKNDLPWEMNSFMADNPGIDVRLGRDLSIDPKLLRAAADRIAAVPGTTIARSDTLLVVVGRGTNDPDANSNIAKLT